MKRMRHVFALTCVALLALSGCGNKQTVTEEPLETSVVLIETAAPTVAPTVAPTIEPTPTPVTLASGSSAVATDSLRLREGPSTESKSLLVIDPGTKLTVESQEGEWSLVNLDQSNIVGYIAEEAISKPDNNKTTTEYNANLRNSAAVRENNVMMTLPKGTTLQILGKEEGPGPTPSDSPSSTKAPDEITFYRVSLDGSGLRGYVMTSFLGVAGGVADTTAGAAAAAATTTDAAATDATATAAVGAATTAAATNAAVATVAPAASVATSPQQTASSTTGSSSGGNLTEVQ